MYPETLAVKDIMVWIWKW